MSYTIDPQTIVDFWRAAGPDRWFEKNAEFDAEVVQRFGDIYERAALGELDAWADDATGALALTILLDQFPRNMFRGDPRMYATDAKAQAIAKAALARGDHLTVGDDVNQFFPMALMHSEDLADQQACVDWMREIGLDNVPFAVEHRDIVERFGRFPHRNAILGREATVEETDYLGAGGFTG